MLFKAVVSALALAALSSCTSEPALAGESAIHFLLGQGKFGNIGLAISGKQHRNLSDCCGQTVRASFYGAGEPLMAHTASGEVFRPLGLTAAHRTLPLGTLLRVALNDRSVIVRVNDRGPAAYTGRDLDLSLGAARALGMTRAGEARVAISIIK